MIARSVLRCAGRPRRGAVSSSRMVPSAPRMSPTCWESSTAVRCSRVVVMVILPHSPVRGVLGGTQHPSALRCAALRCAALRCAQQIVTREIRAERAVTACRKKTRVLGCGADDGPVHRYPCLASLRPWHTGVPDGSTRENADGKPAAHPYSSELWHDTT